MNNALFQQKEGQCFDRKSILVEPKALAVSLVAFLRDYGYVKEFGEGVDRMCAELTELGLPEPEYRVESFMLP